MCRRCHQRTNGLWGRLPPVCCILRTITAALITGSLTVAVCKSACCACCVSLCCLPLYKYIYLFLSLIYLFLSSCVAMPSPPLLLPSLPVHLHPDLHALLTSFLLKQFNAPSTLRHAECFSSARLRRAASCSTIISDGVFLSSLSQGRDIISHFTLLHWLSARWSAAVLPVTVDLVTSHQHQYDRLDSCTSTLRNSHLSNSVR